MLLVFSGPSNYLIIIEARFLFAVAFGIAYASQAVCNEDK
jgi:hypothetical protein